MENPLAVQQGDVIAMRIFVPYEDLDQYRSQTPIAIEGRIVWVKENDGQTYYGVEYANLQQRQRNELQTCFDYFSHCSTYHGHH